MASWSSNFKAISGIHLLILRSFAEDWQRHRENVRRPRECSSCDNRSQEPLAASSAGRLLLSHQKKSLILVASNAQNFRVSRRERSLLYYFQLMGSRVKKMLDTSLDSTNDTTSMLLAASLNNCSATNLSPIVMYAAVYLSQIDVMRCHRSAGVND